jgi:hypothetical protein
VPWKPLLLIKIDGDIYPDKTYQKMLENFGSCGVETGVKSKDDIFSDEENQLNDKMIEAGKKEDKRKLAMKIRKRNIELR